MFYSHEVLTSRKYGVATIWLVATLGSKSTLRKVNRKQILDVNVPKACQTIQTPEAPMALRLQSNLLYGVSRVYSQQCGYVLADAQSAQNHMRQMLRIVKTAELDPESSRARPDQLILPDDPAFLPELAFAPFNLDLANLNDLSSTNPSQQSSILSPHTPISSQSSQEQHDASVAGLLIPTSDTSGAAGIGGFVVLGAEGPPSVRPSGDGFLLDDDLGFDPNVGLGFDDELGLFDIEERARRTSSAPGSAMMGRSTNDPARSGQMRAEDEEDQRTAAEGAGAEFDFQPLQDDGFELLPEGEAFPAPSPQRHQQQDPAQRSSPNTPPETSDTAEAPLRRKRRGPRIIQMDQTMELRNSDLVRWNTNYLQNMAEVAMHKQNHRAAALAKNNASYWVGGAGIGGVGGGIGASRMQGPLSMFSGQQLLDALREPSPAAAGEKRAHESEDDDEARRVRAREDTGIEVGRSSGEEHGRGDVMDIDDGFAPIMDDQDIEIGRDAPSVAEEPSSAMPWNISASIRGSSVARGGRGLSSITGGPVSAGGPSSAFPAPFSRRGSRIATASPLLGRGGPSAPEHEASLEPAGNEFEDDYLGAPPSPSPQDAMDEFELYGPGAHVDTQTAGQSQWTRDTLDTESLNFLAFIQTSINERIGFQPEAEAEQSAETLETRSILFDDLLPPESNSFVVAAQALHHTLALATRNLLKVHQDEAFGPIRMVPMSTST